GPWRVRVRKRARKQRRGQQARKGSSIERKGPIQLGLHGRANPELAGSMPLDVATRRGFSMTDFLRVCPVSAGRLVAMRCAVPLTNRVGVTQKKDSIRRTTTNPRSRLRNFSKIPYAGGGSSSGAMVQVPEN